MGRQTNIVLLVFFHTRTQPTNPTPKFFSPHVLSIFIFFFFSLFPFPFSPTHHNLYSLSFSSVFCLLILHFFFLQFSPLLQTASLSLSLSPSQFTFLINTTHRNPCFLPYFIFLLSSLYHFLLSSIFLTLTDLPLSHSLAEFTFRSNTTQPRISATHFAPASRISPHHQSVALSLSLSLSSTPPILESTLFTMLLLEAHSSHHHTSYLNCRIIIFQTKCIF